MEQQYLAAVPAGPPVLPAGGGVLSYNKSARNHFPAPESETKGPEESQGEPGTLTDELKPLFTSQLRASGQETANLGS